MSSKSSLINRVQSNIDADVAIITDPVPVLDEWRIAYKEDDDANDSNKSFVTPADTEYVYYTIRIDYTSTATVGNRQADPTCYPVVEAEIDGDGNIGELDNTVWTPAERATWETRVLNVLGVLLPAQVDRGKRLIAFFIGALVARSPSQEEMNLRFTHI